jgi:hypothetical protein
MSQTTNEVLIDYLDGNLNPEEISRIEIIIKQDATAAGDLEFLKSAIDTVRLSAIREKVSQVRNARQNEQHDATQRKQGVIRKMYKTGLRIAAVLILLLGSAFLFKLMNVTNQSVFNRQFIPFELTNTRGVQTRDALDEAYLNRNWNEVVKIFQSENVVTNKSRFLAAMAEMELNQYSRAEILFESILNPSNTDKTFHEEAEYYLSLTYLMDHRENKSIALMKKIKADKTHTYFPLASKLSAIDMKIIELKR